MRISQAIIFITKLGDKECRSSKFRGSTAKERKGEREGERERERKRERMKERERERDIYKNIHLRVL